MLAEPRRGLPILIEQRRQVTERTEVGGNIRSVVDLR